MKKILIILIVVSSILGVSFEVIQKAIETNSLLEGLYLFRYFTIQSNFIVFGYFSLLLLFKGIDHGRFHNFFGGVLIYIFITMSIFVLFLEAIYHPTGLYLLASIFNHYITPILVIVFFFCERRDYVFEIKNVKAWIAYPLLYMLFVVIIGSVTGDFLYPFFQVSTVGISGLILAMCALTFLFLLLSFFLVKIVSND